MHVTLMGALINVAIDPFFIFMLKLGFEGAAIAAAIARASQAVVGLAGVLGVHRFGVRPQLASVLADAPALARVALPAVLTNIATPFANTFTTAQVAGFGDAAVAAWAVWGRINPVAFGAVFALSGAIGPIIGQNFGAGDFGRVRMALTQALKVNLLFCTLAWMALWVTAPWLAPRLGALGEAGELTVQACRWLSPLFVFLGALFIANGAFNTLGFAKVATAFNWGRATLGTIPFVWIGGTYFGAIGTFAGSIGGAVLFGTLAVWVAYRQVARLGQTGRAEPRAGSSRPDTARSSPPER
jgi:Na+-driven multidrug efflux pump